MIVVKVSYTVEGAYVEKNQENINIFMEDFKKLSGNDFRYNVYLMNDGQTFVHLSHFKNPDIQNKVLNVPSFKEFQKQRDESGLNNSHKLEEWSFLAATTDILNEP
ncbi:hypothetical protein [Dyadobacter fanqingshengii]|uniref:Uncharacterized protein n=1 Tax=Dyadobacter fanqingshengii TaxID=2906443 RepID=A0A9X1P8S7_9BACT|nr:hypothetical protein [Dyadobacter fanqingshengii]MCF0040481.1 hypothetical protein [Dyadobacter fanqingshengii]USJ37777.1 hypothetical protein NFI81_08325 [Dyadobacter fanqingshengii]